MKKKSKKKFFSKFPDVDSVSESVSNSECLPQVKNLLQTSGKEHTFHQNCLL